MKKRRELDALAGKSTRRKKGQHELLMNNSESSEMEEFVLPQKMNIRKNGAGCRECGKLLPACAMLLLLGCMAATGLLTWLHIQLKQDMEIMRKQLIQGMSDVQDSSRQQISLLNKAQLGNLTTMNSLQKNFTATLKEVEDLKENYRVLSKYMDGAQELTSLPNNVQDLSQNVAGFGSQMSSFEAELKDVVVKLTALELNVSRLGTGSQQPRVPPVLLPSPAPDTSAITDALREFVIQEVNKISEDMARVNETFSVAVHTLDRLHSHERKLEVLRNFTSLLEGRLSQVEGRLIPIEGRLSQMEKTSLNDSHLIPLQYQVVNISSSLQSLASLNDLEKCKEILQNYMNTTDLKLRGIEERLRSLTADPSTGHHPDVVPTETTQEERSDNRHSADKEHGRESPGDGGEGSDVPGDNTDDVDAVFMSQDMDVDSTTTPLIINLPDKSITEEKETNSSAGPLKNFAELKTYFEQRDVEHRGYLTEEALSGLGSDVMAADVNGDGHFTLDELSDALHITRTTEEEESMTSLKQDDVEDLLTAHDTDN